MTDLKEAMEVKEPVELKKATGMTDVKDATSEDLDLERSLAELERIVLGLEDGDLTLEESLKAFERGVSLVRRCNALLDGAEQRIEILTGDLPEDLAR